jgi:hypothetical protein
LADRLDTQTTSGSKSTIASTSHGDDTVTEAANSEDMATPSPTKKMKLPKLRGRVEFLKHQINLI